MRSCLIDELKQRIISAPGEEWTFSVFNSRDIKLDNGYDLKKLLANNQRKEKPVKRVRFKGLPPMEEDGKKKKIMPKDAPKGVEDQNLKEDQDE